jgi:hypothetical protein
VVVVVVTTVSARTSARTTTVPAWNVAEGDRTRAGVAVVSVLRNVATGRVRIGLANGGVLVVAGEHRLAVVQGPR